MNDLDLIRALMNILAENAQLRTVNKLLSDKLSLEFGVQDSTQPPDIQKETMGFTSNH